MKTCYLLINILLLSAVCASCSKDGGGSTPEPELPATPKLSIELNSRDIATKAEDDYTPTKELEGIYDYYIYVVDAATNQVEVAVSGTAQSVDKVSVDDIEVEEGKKNVFAFANLKRIESDPIITDILKLTEGASAGGILSDDQTQEVCFFAEEKTNPLLVDETRHISMSASMASTEVSSKERGYVKLGLYRMFAKIEFEFTNKYEGEVVIEKIEMDGFQNGKVYLMPHKFFPAMEAEMEKDGVGNYKAQDKRDYAPFLPSDSYGEIVQPIVLNGETKITLGAAPEKTEGSTPTYPKSSGHIYYVNETDLATTRDQITSTRFQISLLMTMGGKKVMKPISLPDHTYIRRNDHMIIPITVSDYTFELAVGNSRAPIGGYPEYMQAGVADDFTCTLEYAGKTELFFNLRDVTGELVKGLTTEACTLTLVDDPNDLIAPKGSGGQHSLKLKADGDGTGIITTEINPDAYGTAILSLKITLPDRTLSYTIYLVRERENAGN